MCQYNQIEEVFSALATAIEVCKQGDRERKWTIQGQNLGFCIEYNFSNTQWASSYSYEYEIIIQDEKFKRSKEWSY